MGQEIKGTVVAADGKGVPFATVMLLKSDSSFVAGTMTGEEGQFSITDSLPHNDERVLKVSCLGYSTKYVHPNHVDNLRITLESESTILSEVVVKSNRPTYQQKTDGIVTNVSGTVLSKLGAAEEALAYVPMLRKTNKGYEVFGKGTPLIYINGRRVRDDKELDRLHAADIKDITLMTAPGAEYDATVQAVLKIRTVPKAGDGFSMEYRQVMGFAHKPLHREQLDLNYRKDGWDVFATLYYSKFDSWQKQNDRQYIDDGVTLLLNSRLGLYSTDKFGLGMTGFNWQISDKHSLGATYTIDAPFKSKGGWWSEMEVTTGDDTEQLDDLFNTESSRLPRHDITAYYSSEIGKLHLDWNGEAYLTRSNLRQQSHETENTSGDSRQLLFTLRYRLNSARSKYKGVSAGGANKNRL
ncbi:MAG: carboxypeptidase regulatory-like domain-containing protein [Prevotella sp.]|jgi:hypothetical protein